MCALLLLGTHFKCLHQNGPGDKRSQRSWELDIIHVAEVFPETLHVPGLKAEVNLKWKFVQIRTCSKDVTKLWTSHVLLLFISDYRTVICVII